MKRRDFIVKGGLVTTGILTTSRAMPFDAYNLAKNNTINIGVIGTG